jgi:hypothetical protein
VTDAGCTKGINVTAKSDHRHQSDLYKQDMFQSVLPFWIDHAAFPDGVRRYIRDHTFLFIERGIICGWVDKRPNGHVLAYISSTCGKSFGLDQPISTVYHEIGHMMQFPPFNRDRKSYDEDETFARVFEVVMWDRSEADTKVNWEAEDPVWGTIKYTRLDYEEQRKTRAYRYFSPVANRLADQLLAYEGRPLNDG